MKHLQFSESRQTRQKMAMYGTLMLLLLLGLLVAEWARVSPVRAQGDDIFCAQYANQAIEQYEANLEYACGYSGPEWSPDYSYHFNWCMQGNNSQYVDGGTEYRAQALRQCLGEAPLVKKCDSYAKTAVAQNNENQMRACGFSDSRWSSDYDYHYNWCTLGNNSEYAGAGTTDRQEMLDQQCPTGRGDLAATNWCFDIYEPPGMGGTVTISFHPLITNVGDQDWSSKNEGTYLVGARTAAEHQQASYSLPGFPHWSIKTGETKVLEGVTLPFSEANIYYDMGSWLLTHPDDTNPQNNELVNLTVPAVEGRAFLPDGSLAHMQCPAIKEDQCDAYAQIATAQQQENLGRGCGYTGSLWNADYAFHYNSCLNAASQTAQLENVERAWALMTCQANPRCTPAMDVTVRLRNIEVIDEADGPGNAAPYLFPIFFKIDPETQTDVLAEIPYFTWFHAPGGSHKNLGTNNEDYWAAGDVIHIPANIGTWHTTLWRGNPGDDFLEESLNVAAVVLLLEEDLAPPSEDIMTGYAQFANVVSGSVHHPVAFALLKAVPLAEQPGPRQALEDKIETEIITLLNPDIPVDIDDFIGVSVFAWSWSGLKAQPYQASSQTWGPDTGSEDGTFTINVDVIGSPVCR